MNQRNFIIMVKPFRNYREVRSTFSRIDQSPCHHRILPVDTHLSKKNIGKNQKNKCDLFFLLLFFLFCSSSGGGCSPTSCGPTRSSDGSTTRWNLEKISLTILLASQIKLIVTEASLAEPSAMSYKTSVRKKTVKMYLITYIVDILSFEVRNQFVQAFIVGLNSNGTEDLFDIFS